MVAALERGTSLFEAAKWVSCNWAQHVRPDRASIVAIVACQAISNNNAGQMWESSLGAHCVIFWCGWGGLHKGLH
jgi:hypothetical protein